MKSSGKMLMRLVIGLVFGAGLVLGVSTGANAQGHSQRHARNYRWEHQQQERYYRNDHTNRGGGYNSRFYDGGNVHSRGRAVHRRLLWRRPARRRHGGAYYGRGQHGGYYGDGHYRGYYGGGHRGYGTRYPPHHDSHNPVARFFHHVLGGH